MAMFEPLRKLARCGLLAAGPALPLAWAAGLFFRDTDRSLLALYFLPAPFVAVFCLVWLWFMRRRGARGLRVATAGLLLLVCAKITCVDMRWNGWQDEPAHAVRVTHWNVARLPLATGKIQAVLAGDAPDICLLSETRPGPATETAGAAMGLTNVHFVLSMTLLSRWPIEPLQTLSLPEARGWSARVDTPAGRLDILAIDVISKPQLDRKPALAAVAEWVRAHDPAIPLLVLGDFNTPSDATAFRPLRSLLAHGYETAGRGWPYSWPLPAPMYAIDHTWYATGTVRLVNYRLRSAAISDHRRQTMCVELLQPARERT